MLIEKTKNESLIPDCSVVIPVNGGSNGTVELIEKLDKTLKAKKYSYEAIIVDGTSSSKFYYRVRELRNFYPIKILKIGKNKYGKTLLNAIESSYGKTIVRLPADADKKEGVERVLEQIEGKKLPVRSKTSANSNSNFKDKLFSFLKRKFSQTAFINERTSSIVHKKKEYLHFSNLAISESAFFPITLEQKGLLTLLVLLFFLFFLTYPMFTLTLAFSVIVFVYFSTLFFNILVRIRGYGYKGKPELDNNQVNQEESVPMYTIICPLYNEWSVVNQFVESIKNLNYPKEKLQVLLLLEEDDKKTYTALSSIHLPSYFEKITVPHTDPKTKPKACNYGLAHATGKYTVIFDAEDVPDKDQLRMVVNAFSKSSPEVICMQAKLNFYNSEQNILTRLFTAEYSLWFDLILPGLQSFDFPIPLGGTSNHFITDKLRTLHGWDSFNVTEDCDLGIRVHKKGYKTKIIDSVTWEEANSSIGNWINQRSRWVKGYIQTYLVHNRRDNQSFSDGLSKLSFHMIVGGKVFSLLINPIMWTISISYFAFRPVIGSSIEALFPPVVFYLGIVSMVGGNFIYFYSFMIALLKKRKFHLVKYVFFSPLYFLFMSFAAWKAFFQLITNPHYWFKTKHGLHLESKNKTLSKISRYAYS